MSFFVEDKGNFESTPPGMHLARCYSIIDLGTQKTMYMGTAKFLHKIRIGWEILGTDDSGKPIRMRDGRPFSIFKNYTLSWSDKANLRLDLQSWRGKPFSQEEIRRFDLSTVLGAWCMLNTIEKAGQDGKTYVNVATVSPLPAMVKKSGLPDAVNPNEIFVLSDPDMKVFERFSDYLKEKIQASPEWAKNQDVAPKHPVEENPFADEDGEDPIPF